MGVVSTMAASALSLLFLVAFAKEASSACSPCCSSAEQYTEHFQEVLGGAPASTVCQENQLMSRIQTGWPGDGGVTAWPDKLSKYGNFWVFASDNNVLNKFLELAQTYGGDRFALLQQMMFHVGFDNKTVSVDLVGEGASFSVVVFDRAEMETQWNEGPIPAGVFQQPFQPTWSNLASYLKGDAATPGFQVCSSDSHTPPENCIREQVDITDDLEFLEGYPYQALTGCDKGYASGETVRDHDDCLAAGCDDIYCTMLDEFAKKDIRNGGSPRCVDHYHANPLGYSGYEHGQWTRAMFEMCFACNPYFTGEGVGYNPEEDRTTMSEWIVRGDSQTKIGDLKASRMELWP